MACFMTGLNVLLSIQILNVLNTYMLLKEEKTVINLS